MTSRMKTLSVLYYPSPYDSYILILLYIHFKSEGRYSDGGDRHFYGDGRLSAQHSVLPNGHRWCFPAWLLMSSGDALHWASPLSEDCLIAIQGMGFSKVAPQLWNYLFSNWDILYFIRNSTGIKYYNLCSLSTYIWHFLLLFVFQLTGAQSSLWNGPAQVPSPWPP